MIQCSIIVILFCDIIDEIQQCLIIAISFNDDNLVGNIND